MGYFKGHKHSEETRKKLSVSWKKKYKKGYVNPLKGLVREDISGDKNPARREDVKEKIKKNVRRGEEHPFYKDGMARKITEYREAHPTCEVCKKRKTRYVHHKDWNRENNNKGNFAAVCTICHDSIHRDKCRFCENTFKCHEESYETV